MSKLLALTAVLLAAGLSLAAANTPATAGEDGHHSCTLPVFGPGVDYHPAIDPDDFSAGVTNPWFPLKPGTTYVYAGTKDDQKAIDVFAVSKRTKVIDGVQTRVVNDRLYLNGVLEERTSDYYSQDRCGNVWYFGEDTAQLDAHGNVVSRDGSFRAGVGGAQPGVFMQAHPEFGRQFRQEWSAGNAEDTFKVIAENETVTVPFGRFHHALRTQETTALEPEVVDNKLYARGVGEVVEVAVKGPVERLLLVDVLS